MLNPKEIELLEKYIDGTLADRNTDQLHTLLRDNPMARAKLRSLATIDFGLQDIADSRGLLNEPKIPVSKRSMTIASWQWATYRACAAAGERQAPRQIAAAARESPR